MFLYSTADAIRHPQDIEHLLLYTKDGGIVPLSSVASVEETVNTESIRRVDGARTITLSIVPPREIPLEVGVEMVNRELIDGLRDSGDIDESVQMHISGASDLLNATREALQSNFIIAVVVSYLLLVAIFSHWGYPFLILTSVPIGISGGIVGLWLLNLVGANLEQFGMANIHQPYDMITMLGFLVLIGTVVNNPILLVERALRRLKEGGVSAAEAVSESVRVRLRPDHDVNHHHHRRLVTFGLLPWCRYGALPRSRRHCAVWIVVLHHCHPDVHAGDVVAGSGSNPEISPGGPGF